MTASNPDIATALSTLEARDPAAAEEARAALDWLTAGEGLAVLSQDALQYFLWYQLPVKWLTDDEHHRRVVAALAAALDLLGLPRYAAICRSDTTTAVLDAYRRGRAQGRAAFHKAADASAVTPSDLPELQWGDLMGPQEARVLSSVADFLELAITAGELVPGGRGWKGRREELVRAHLRQTRPDLGSGTLLDIVRAERLENWQHLHRDGAWPSLLPVLAPHLDRPAALPPGTTDPIPPLRWLLERLADGQPLTQKGNLSRAFVEEASTLFDWWPAELHSRPRNEADLYDLSQTHHLAQHLKALRRRGASLTLSRLGRELLADPEALWRAAAHAILPKEAFYTAAGEITLALLVVENRSREAALDAVVTETIAAQGWHDRETGEPADKHAISIARHATTNLLRALNLIESRGRWPQATLRLTLVGRATALEALHHRATGPMRHPTP